MAFGKFGRYHPDGADVHVADVDLVALVRRQTTDPRIRLDARAERIDLQTDPLHVEYVLVNLLHNALKYSDGEVRVAVVPAPDGGLLTVGDDGIGIPQAEIDALFSPFYRASNVAARPGTGMGLAILKKSANLIGAQIAVASEEGAGTTFTVTFPRTPADWRA